VLKNGFTAWLHTARPDILCLQETRVMPEELTEADRSPDGYQIFWNPAVRKGYSGTAVYTRIPPRSVTGMGVDAFDAEGRLQVIEFDAFTVLNGYWPNSQDQRARLDYKLDYVRAVARMANRLVKQGKRLVICGDYNIAHREIDLARPKQNEDSPGYYIEEREAMTRFLGHGYVDTFRHFCGESGHYTWWSYRTRARERNIGWRLDYHCVDAALLPSVRRSWILSDVMGSDHCPVGLELE
jgi:exodeoxyribonuclease-3